MIRRWELHGRSPFDKLRTSGASRRARRGSQCAPLFAVALAAAAACGPSREERLMRDRAAICDGLTAQAGLTLTGALSQLEAPYVCTSPASTEPPLARDTCGNVPIREIIAIFPVSDTSICSSGIGGGCGFYCQVRVTDADFTALGSSATVCASQWYGAVCAPTPFWCPYPLC